MERILQKYRYTAVLIYILIETYVLQLYVSGLNPFSQSFDCSLIGARSYKGILDNLTYVYHNRKE